VAINIPASGSWSRQEGFDLMSVFQTSIWARNIKETYMGKISKEGTTI
jgi:hypothetical protein